MIHFSCPTCRKALKSPDKGAGQKMLCPSCGQRLLIPPPTQVQNKTILGKLIPEAAATPATSSAGVKPPVALPPPGQVLFDCPGCFFPLMIPAERVGRWVECTKCGMGFAALADKPSTAPDSPPNGGNSGEDTNAGRPTPFGQKSPMFGSRGGQHSGLGIAAFIIALLVGGLDVILALVIAISIARSRQRPDLAASAVAGGMSMGCLNIMSIPLCLVGLGLALVALIAHRDRNHLFTWIGLLGNGVVILGVIGLFLLGAMLGN